MKVAFDEIRCSHRRWRTGRTKRCRRSALLCDEGQQRNLSSPAIHGLLGREGRSPAAFLGEARQELTRYNSVSIRGTKVTDIVSVGGSFEFSCAGGTTGNASKILLAMGLIDELPELSGIEPLYGISIHHCLYCDGFEYAGKPVAALGKGDKGAELAPYDETLDPGRCSLQRWD